LNGIPQPVKSALCWLGCMLPVRPFTVKWDGWLLAVPAANEGKTALRAFTNSAARRQSGR